MKIIDAFTFYNELDLLLYRLSALDHVVDYFIIVEATKSHAGKDKELFFENNKHLYEKFLPKIIHIIDEDLIVPEISAGQQWYNEIHQRDEIYRGLEILDPLLHPGDYLCITDLDEIPDPKILLDLKNEKINHDFAALEMDFYYYNLNCKIMEQWYHGKVIKYGFFKRTPNITCNKLRMGRPISMIHKAGWHLSYFGDGEFIKNKLENFAHQEFNKEQYTNVDTINKCIENYYNIFEGKACNRYVKVPIAENDFLPPLYNTLLTRFIKC
jgi:beta-1,4-mannosyl-glycoprotein beta-1,4-N-acetylglucosaminyltransferase